MADKEVIVRVKVEGLSAGAIEVQKLNVQFAQLNKEYKDLQKTIGKNQQGNATQEQLNKLASLSTQMKENKITQSDLNKVMDSANDSLNVKTAKLAALTAQYKAGGSTIEKNLLPEMNKLRAEIDKSEHAIGLHQRNVGNYASAWAGVPGPIGRAATTIQGFKQTLESVSGNLSKSVTDISGFGKAAGDTGEVLQEFGNVAGNETAKVATVVKGFGKDTQAAMGAAGTATEGFGASVKAAGKVILTTPIGWLILAVTALVAVYAGLFSIWKSTGEGAGKLKNIMAGLHGIVDVLRNQVISLIDAFGHLFKGEFKKAAEDFGGAVGLTGESMKEAAVRAAELSKMQRQLTKDLAMHISEEANENMMIQQYLMLSKDKTKSDKERLDYLKEAMKISEEKAKREMEFATRQFKVDIGNAALKGQIDEKMLSEWIAMDQEKQKEVLAGSEVLRNALNRLGGTKALQALEESYARIINAQTEYFQTNKRTTSQISTFEKESASDRDKRAKERITLREMEAKGDVELMKKVAREKYEAEIGMQEVSDTQKLVLKKQYEEEVTKIEQDALKERIALLEDQAKGSIEAEKKVAKMKYEAEIAEIGISETQKQILRRKYNDEIAKLDQDVIDEFIVKENEKKDILKKSLDLQLINLKLNEEQKSTIREKYNSDIENIDKGITEKRKAILQKSLTDDLELYGKQLSAITDSNSIKLAVQKGYEDKVIVIQSKKLDKAETDKQINALTDRLQVQLAKIREYEKDLIEIDKKNLESKKATLKSSMDEQIKAIEDEKKLYIDAQKEKGTPLNKNGLYELEKKTQDQIMQLRTDYVTQSAALDAQYFANKQAALEKQLATDLKLNEDNLQAQAALKKKYNEDIIQLNADAAIIAGNALLAEVEAARTAEDAKRQLKIASGEWDKERLLIDEANRLQILEMSGQNEFEVKRRQLATQYQAEKEAAKNNGADLLLIEQKNATARKVIDRTEANSRLELFSNLMGSIAGILGENTAAGKAAAVAQATINTYLAATEAYAAGLKVGGPAGLVLAPIMAGVAIVAGLLNVQKILAVPIPGKSTANKSAGFAEGGKIDRGIPVNTGTKDDRLIAVNGTETILTKEQVERLGGSRAMAAAGVPGYPSVPKPSIQNLGSGILTRIKPFASGGAVGIQPTIIGTGNFNMLAFDQIVNTMNQNIEAINIKSDAINSRIDKIQVVQDVNKLNLAQKELSVINQTQRI